VRVPPLKLDQPTERPRSAAKIDGDAEFLRSLILYEDADMMILNRHPHARTRLQPVVRLGALAIDPQLALADDALHASEGTSSCVR
jgi:hypothetical protein